MEWHEFADAEKGQGVPWAAKCYEFSDIHVNVWAKYWKSAQVGSVTIVQGTKIISPGLLIRKWVETKVHGLVMKRSKL